MPLSQRHVFALTFGATAVVVAATTAFDVGDPRPPGSFGAGSAPRSFEGAGPRSGGRFDGQLLPCCPVTASPIPYARYDGRVMRTFAFSDVGGAFAIPPVRGFGGTLTFAANSASRGTHLTIEHEASEGFPATISFQFDHVVRFGRFGPAVRMRLPPIPRPPPVRVFFSEGPFDIPIGVATTGANGVVVIPAGELPKTTDPDPSMWFTIAIAGGP